MLNLAYEEDYEIIEGEKVMSPSPHFNHSLIAMRLGIVLGVPLFSKYKGYVVTETDVHLPDGNILKPDLIALSVENQKIIDKRGRIRGVPDMVVEIFSRSTMQRDRTIKKDIYEANGVKEYWMIDPFAKTVEVLILRDGKFAPGNFYVFYDEEDWVELTEDEQQNSPQKIFSTVFENLVVELSDVFGWYI